jgi:hypothetical protein
MINLKTIIALLVIEVGLHILEIIIDVHQIL